MLNHFFHLHLNITVQYLCNVVDFLVFVYVDVSIGILTAAAAAYVILKFFFFLLAFLFYVILKFLLHFFFL